MMRNNDTRDTALEKNTPFRMENITGQRNTEDSKDYDIKYHGLFQKETPYISLNMLGLRGSSSICNVYLYLESHQFNLRYLLLKNNRLHHNCLY